MANIKSANVCVIGSGNLAQIIGLLLTQSVSDVRLEQLTLIDNAKVKTEPAILPLEVTEDNFKAHRVLSVASALQKVNASIRSYDDTTPEIQVFPVVYRSIEEARNNINLPDVIIDTKNSVSSKIATNKFAKENNLPAIFAVAAHSGKCELEYFDVSSFEGSYQNPIVSGVVGGAVVEQVIYLANGLKPRRGIDYALPFEATELGYVRDKTVAMIGTGALGNVMGPLLALSGVNIKFSDFDLVEKKNCQKQYLYSNFFGPTEGLKKITVFENTLKEILRLSGLMSGVNGVSKKIRSVSDLEELTSEADSLLLAVDNDWTRMLASKFGVASGIPITDPALNQSGGRVAQYFSGKTICLHHQVHYRGCSPKKSPNHVEPVDSCNQCEGSGVPCGNVVVPARIVGSMAAAEVLAAILGRPLSGAYIQYLWGDETIAIGVREDCECLGRIPAEYSQISYRKLKLDPCYGDDNISLKEVPKLFGLRKNK
ncbi:MAG: ThiF family adenylyltransferase [DPANN group archaeon]|nr:ThiF family adenylyltransferase [DPANN group archaeon]